MINKNHTWYDNGTIPVIFTSGQVASVPDDTAIDLITDDIAIPYEVKIIPVAEKKPAQKEERKPPMGKKKKRGKR